jgi:DNA-binding response OmpR family regulator
MSLETKKIKEALCNCHILVVEDDAPLASRIVRLFTDFTVPPEIAHSMEQARRIIADGQGNFGLAIMDVMLPPSDEDFKEIREHEKTLERVRKEVEEAGTHPVDDNAKRRLFDARYNRAQALRQIESLIDPEGGIKLVEEWRSSNQLFPILFLTAVGNDKMVKRGRSAAGEYSDWAVKPVPSILILEKCVNLLLKSQKQAGDDRL